MNWEQDTEIKFNKLLSKMPVFMRPMAEKALRERAEKVAAKDNRAVINEKDMVDAFFTETPFGFQGMMKNDLQAEGIDYVKYGYSK